ncbi:hypothetical protein D9Q98_007587 [Chlorella vulgaris]|uniref:DNA (cytosine-5-)-methyltransferase n=1 Tax=Chlorella vulgaris TaxID=3077 RepID=A0A9D4TLM2_CHLVU|nr:hypothetical protein D9Q98_007587 [Chlorella vulgaris]
MRITSLFSGCGGLDIGLHQAGHELLLLCDSDAGARQVLRTAFPGVRIHDDVISLEKLPEETELLVAGFPCIDVSRAGLRRGLEGQSTGLRAKDDNRAVPWVLLENVEALLDRHQGEPPVMQYCTQKFIEMGYQSWAYRVVNSAGFGLPNRRRRVFLVASLHGDARDVLLSQGSQKCTGGCEQLFGTGRRCYPCHAAELRNMRHHRRVSYALDMGNAMSPAGEDVVPTFTTSNDRMLLALADGTSGMLRVEDAERLQGLEEGYTRPCWPIQTPGIAAHRSVRHNEQPEAAASKRWDLLGNAVTVPVARWLGERLAHPYQYKYHGVSTQDRPLEHLIAEGAAPDALADLRPRQRHVWSHVATDQLQDALIFEYLSIAQRKQEAARRRKHRARTAAAADRLLAGMGDAGEVWEAEAAAAAAGDYASGSDAGSGSEGEGEEGLAGLEGLDPEAAEMVAVARAARKEAAAERAAKAAAAAAAPTPQQLPSPDSGAGGSSNGEGEGEADGSKCDSPTPASASAAAAANGGTRLAATTTPSAAAVKSTARAAGTSGLGVSDGEEEEEDGAVAAAAKTQARLDLAEAEEEQRDLFQAAIVRRKQRGLVQQQARQQGVWDREAWPRAAWYVRGLGCFGCEEMSECPVPTPFIPLGDFISEVGREGRQEEIHTYLHRMREKGWDVGRTIEKLLHNGARISAEAHEIVRVPGLLTDADMIGDLVWVWDKTVGCWWPGEKLDPLSMPPGRDLPAGAVRALSATEKLVSLKQYKELAGKLTEAQRAESRRVLVAYLPVSCGLWQWYRPAEVEPFEGNAEREREACALIKSNGGRWKHGEEMGRAVKDAKASLYIKANRNCLEADRMRRTRASAAAGAVNLKQRCGQCKTCMNSIAGQRRFDCLTQRMKAAALSGHAGAQVGVNGEGAIGARVQVWWEGDQCFYSGVLALYDPVSTEHTVCYDDGEVGMHRLWQHDERIRLESPVEHWPRDATLARHRLQLAQERLRSRDVGRRTAGLAPLPAPPPPPAAEAQQPGVVSAEELRRKNKAAFEAIMAGAGKGLQATGQVPTMTPQDLQVVAAAQQAARIAATQTAQHRQPAAAAAAPAAAGGRTRAARGAALAAAAVIAGAAAAEVAAEAEAGAEAGGWSGELPAEITDMFRGGGAGTSPVAGRSRKPSKRTRSPQPASEDGEGSDGGGASEGEYGHSQHLTSSLKRNRFMPLEKCGTCAHCLEPSRKKACKLVLMQRKELHGLRAR